jgi:hypothetical protein
MEIAPWITALACSSSLLLSGAALLWVVLFSAPASLRKYVDHSVSIAKDAENRVEEVEMRFIAHKAETTAIHESIESVLASVEKKRKQTAAGVSRLNLAEAPAPTTREEIVAQARARTYGGV